MILKLGQFNMENLFVLEVFLFNIKLSIINLNEKRFSLGMYDGLICVIKYTSLINL